MTAKQLYQLHSQLFLISFPELPQSEHISVADATWVALNVVSGGSNTSTSQPIGVTKIAKSVIAPLADHNISVFMLSTYQTDFILVSVNIVHVNVLCVNGVGLDSHVMPSKNDSTHGSRAGAIPVDVNQYHRIKNMGVVSEKGWHRSPLNILSNNQQGAFCTTIYDLETSFALWLHVEYNRQYVFGVRLLSVSQLDLPFILPHYLLSCLPPPHSPPEMGVTCTVI